MSEQAPARWRDLRRFTPARVGLGRAGNSLPTAAHLDFQLAHAQARDAVHSALDLPALAADLAARGFASLAVSSAAPDRRTYLMRPDLGRRLAEADRARLGGSAVPGAFVFAIGDGLCATGVQRHAPEIIARTAAAIAARGYPPAPVVIATGARVALGDEIGAVLGAAAVAMLIGERPGLSAIDSMGIYLTHDPRPGRSDAERNCISNVRPAGLPYPAAAHRLAHLMNEARHRGLSGVGLKDDSEIARLPGGAGAGRNFLLGGG